MTGWHISKGFRACILAGGLMLLFEPAGAATAGNLEVKTLNAPGRVEIDARDARVDDILTELGKTSGIKIERIGDDGAARMWSGRLSGRIEDVLSRLLESENFVVEHAAGAKSGISRIRVFAATETDEIEVTQGTPQPAVASRTPPPQQQPQVQPPRPQPAPSAAAAPPPPAAQPAATQPNRNAGAQPQRPQTRSTQAGAQRRGGVVQ